MSRPKKNPLEWTVFAASAAIVLAIVCILIVQAVGGTDGPAELRITLGEPQHRAGVYMVPAQVWNEGGRTAAEVTVEVTLASAGKDVETAELQIAFVPAGSYREGWVAFRRDPSCCEMTAAPVSFESP